MKRSIFVPVFVGAHILAVFIQIHQYSRIIKANYQKQKIESLLVSLTQKKQQLTHQLYALHNKTKIKEFAIQKLHMEPVTLGHIKKLPTHDTKTT